MRKYLTVLLLLLVGNVQAADVTNPNITPYIVGSWTPVDNSGASLTFTGVSAGYTRIGNMVFAYTNFQYPATADASAASIGGFPVAFPAAQYARQCELTGASSSSPADFLPNASTITGTFKALGLGAITNAQMSNALVFLICSYPAS